MKILISQPLHETNLKKLEEEISFDSNFDAILFPEGYLANEEV